MLDRRDVLRLGTAGTLTAAGTVVARPASAAVGSAAGSTAAATAIARDVSGADWRALAKSLSPRASLYRPWDRDFRQLSIPFNHRYEAIQPAGIVACATTADVVAS